MKRIALTILLACFAWALSAQGGIPVKYQGAKPTISDLTWALISYSPDDQEEDFDEPKNALVDAWKRHQQGLPQEENVTLTIDQKNGFVLYESKRDENIFWIELCFWNEADQQHKLLAYNVTNRLDGVYSAGQYDALVFYRYDNATKMLTRCDDPGFEPVMGTDDGKAWISYNLPRTGKDITAHYWYEDGKHLEKTLKWNGHGFGF